MAIYDIEFSEKLAETAKMVAQAELDEVAAQKTVLYLSLVSIEITLKSLLEKAGVSVKNIRNRSHNLQALLDDIPSLCTTEKIIGNGQVRRYPAAGLRGQIVDGRFDNGTVGAIIDGAASTASKYPNEFRYGEQVSHYPPQLLMKTAFKVLEWTKKHWETIQVKP